MLDSICSIWQPELCLMHQYGSSKLRGIGSAHKLFGNYFSSYLVIAPSQLLGLTPEIYMTQTYGKQGSRQIFFIAAFLTSGPWVVT